MNGTNPPNQQEEAFPPVGGEAEAPTPTEAPVPVITAVEELENQIEDAIAGRLPEPTLNRVRLLQLCHLLDYWLCVSSRETIESLGLDRLSTEIRRDYVLSSFLAWRSEYKLGYIALRSFLESFCLLLYYLNQGCDRMLYLKGYGYKHMLHRMAQKKDPEETHAFRRHYHLLLEESNSVQYANKFFDEIGACYSLLSKAVHGDYSLSRGETNESNYLNLICRVLRICNTLALHDPLFEVTEDDLDAHMQGSFKPLMFKLANA